MIQVKFTVLIESSNSLSEQPWEAIIWHNGHENREWRELAMIEITTETTPVNSHLNSQSHLSTTNLIVSSSR